MIIYYGTKKEVGNCRVLIKEIDDEDGSILEQNTLKHSVRHSPGGFQWGYEGSGPADLALSILTDFQKRTMLGICGFVDNNYQKFKRDFIGKAGDQLKITSDEIIQWLTTNKLLKKEEKYEEQKISKK
jgi:hypothetical protein